MSAPVMWKVASEAGTDWCCIHCGDTALPDLMRQHALTDRLRVPLEVPPAGTVCAVQTSACTAWREAA